MAAELTAMYASGLQQGFLKTSPMYSVNAGLRKSWLNNKLSVSLNVNDIFDSFKIKAKMKTDTQSYALNINRDNRYVSLSLKYTFGSDKVKSIRNRKTGAEDEAGRAKN